MAKPSDKPETQRRFSEKVILTSSSSTFTRKKPESNTMLPRAQTNKPNELKLANREKRLEIEPFSEENVLPEKEAMPEEEEEELNGTPKTPEENKSNSSSPEINKKPFGLKLEKVTTMGSNESSLSLKHSKSSVTSAVKEKLQQAKRKIIINSKEQDQRVLGVSSWKSLRNLVELLPRFVGLKDLVRDFGSFASEWKDFFIQSFKEIREKDSDFPVLPGNAHQRLSAIETLILMKYLRPEELINYINSFHTSVFKRTLTHGSRTNLDYFSRAALSKRPTVVFCDDRNSNIEELLELKAHLQKSTGGVGTFNCLNKSQETIGKELERSAQKGQWLVIVDFELLDAQSARLVIKKIGLETQNQKSSPNWKVWLIYRIGKRQKGLDIGIRDFFSGCSRVFLNPPDNVRDQIASFYSVELQEYEKKSALRASKPQITDFRALSSTERDIRLHRMKIPRKNDTCSLLCLIDRVDLAQKNSNFSVLLDKYSEKIRFRLCFVYSLIVERKKYELGIRRHRKVPLFELPQSEFQNLLDEIFTFLGLFSLNPFIFLEKALVIEREHFEEPYSSFYVDQLVRKLLTEYVFVEIENQMILDVKGFKYELFSAGAGLSNEEKVYKTLNGFPNEDPIELFGFNLNTEIMLNYRHSNKIMQAVLKQEEVHRKAEGLRSHVLRSLENIKFLEGDGEDENNTKSFEFLEGNIKEFLKFVLKIFLDNEKSKETLVDLSKN